MECSPLRRALAEPLESRMLLTATVSGTPTIVNADKVTGAQQDPTIVYNPTNPNDMYMVADNVGTSLLTSSSTNGGATWTSQVRFTGSDGFPPATIDPTAAYDSYGNLFVAYTRGDNGSTEVLYSYDNGQTFHVLTSLSGVQSDPLLATGPGSLWLAVQQNKQTGNPASVANSGAVVYAAKVTGLGRIGALKRVASLSTVNSVVESIAVGSAGQVVVAYQYATDIGPTVVYTRTDPDGLGPKPFGPANVQVISNVGTNTVITPVTAFGTVTGITAGASLAFDDSADAYTGRLYMAYVSAASPTSENTVIDLVYSDNDGATWSSPVQVNDDTSINSHFMPSIAVDPVTGSVAITWYDSRNDNGIPGAGGTDDVADDDVQVYGAVGSPTSSGVSLSPNFVIQPAYSNLSDDANPDETGSSVGYDANGFGLHNSLVFYDGHVVTAWSDNSNSTGDNADGDLSFFDIYAGSYTVATTNPPASSTLIGSFGSTALNYTEPDGTRATFHVSKGYGSLFVDSSGDLELRLSDTTSTSVLTITAYRGSRSVTLASVTDTGPLGSIVAKDVNLTGMFSVSGSVNHVTLGNLSGGTFAASGAIGTMRVASLTNAFVLSGATPGPQNVFGAGVAGNTFAAGSIKSLIVTGAITNSVVGAGVNPVDGVFGNGNDTIIGGTASRIGTLRASTADSASRFEAGAFGTVRLPQLIDPATDSRFLVD